MQTHNKHIDNAHIFFRHENYILPAESSVKKLVLLFDHIWKKLKHNDHLEWSFD